MTTRLSRARARSSGVSQTSIVVACLRRLQHWNTTSILVEVRGALGRRAACSRASLSLRRQQSLGLTTSRYTNEQFIELFDIDLVTLPAQLPAWFVEQERLWQSEQKKEAASEKKPLDAPSEHR